MGNEAIRWGSFFYIEGTKLRIDKILYKKGGCYSDVGKSILIVEFYRTHIWLGLGMLRVRKFLKYGLWMEGLFFCQFK